jgi:hypothetical protein
MLFNSIHRMENDMLTTTRNIALGLALATVLSPAAALAKNGADDGPAHAGDDKGGQRTAPSVEPGDDKGGQRTGTEPGDDKGGQRTSKGGRKAKRVAGSCTGNSSAKLKVKPDNGRLETEFEVDQNRNGVDWAVRIRRNGKLAVKTTATTKAPSGSFSVERRLRNGRGKDKITARATSPSGEVCTARLTI